VRYSIDFRTVHLGDVLGRIGAPNVDSECTGTTMGDYLRGIDLSRLPGNAVSMYHDGTEMMYSESLEFRDATAPQKSPSKEGPAHMKVVSGSAAERV